MPRHHKENPHLITTWKFLAAENIPIEKVHLTPEAIRYIHKDADEWKSQHSYNSNSKLENNRDDLEEDENDNDGEGADRLDEFRGTHNEFTVLLEEKQSEDSLSNHTTPRPNIAFHNNPVNTLVFPLNDNFKEEKQPDAEVDGTSGSTTNRPTSASTKPQRRSEWISKTRPTTSRVHLDNLDGDARPRTVSDYRRDRSNRYSVGIGDLLVHYAQKGILEEERERERIRQRKVQEQGNDNSNEANILAVSSLDPSTSSSVDPTSRDSKSNPSPDEDEELQLILNHRSLAHAEEKAPNIFWRPSDSLKEATDVPLIVQKSLLLPNSTENPNPNPTSASAVSEEIPAKNPQPINKLLTKLPPIPNFTAKRKNAKPELYGAWYLPVRTWYVRHPVGESKNSTHVNLSSRNTASKSAKKIEKVDRVGNNHSNNDHNHNKNIRNTGVHPLRKSQKRITKEWAISKKEQLGQLYSSKAFKAFLLQNPQLGISSLNSGEATENLSMRLPHFLQNVKAFDEEKDKDKFDDLDNDSLHSNSSALNHTKTHSGNTSTLFPQPTTLLESQKLSILHTTDTGKDAIPLRATAQIVAQMEAEEKRDEEINEKFKEFIREIKLRELNSWEASTTIKFSDKTLLKAKKQTKNLPKRCCTASASQENTLDLEKKVGSTSTGGQEESNAEKGSAIDTDSEDDTEAIDWDEMFNIEDPFVKAFQNDQMEKS